jgi:hypothetical protein
MRSLVVAGRKADEFVVTDVGAATRAAIALVNGFALQHLFLATRSDARVVRRQLRTAIDAVLGIEPHC